MEVESTTSHSDLFYNSATSHLQILDLHPAIIDSGTTSHFLLCDAPCNNRRPTNNPITCQLPTGITISSTHEAKLNLPNCNLPPEALTAHLFPELQHSLLSIRALCDHGCTTLFNTNNVIIECNGQQIFVGHWHPTNKLWYLDLAQPIQQINTSPASPLAFSAYSAASTTSDLVQFLHVTCFSPVQSTLIKAIDKGHFATWPSFTAANIQCFLPKSPGTTMGHLNQVRKKQSSTKVKPPQPNDDSNNVIPSPPSTDGKCTQFVYAAIVQALNESGQIYTNQTGRFPVTSRGGNKYIMILYDYDSNSILAEPMKSQTDDEIIRSYQALHGRLIAAGLKP
jgi:hypothetical protein